MSKLATAAAGALSLLILSSCGGWEPATSANAAENLAAAEESNEVQSAPAAHSAQPGAPADAANGTIPPPDAVSHPNGYLPPAPAEPESPAMNSSGPDPSPPATEDEYIRNRQ